MTTAQTINICLSIPFMVICAVIIYCAAVKAAIADQARQKRPMWERCEMCEDFWCNKHQKHTHECDCPPIEELPHDPYLHEEIYRAQDHSSDDPH